MWIYGYGSLIWRPDFDDLERRPGFIRGWSRRFYQGSTDHRGVPGAPGRVVTLVPDPESRCWGMAFRIESHVADQVLAGLDYREKGGYVRRFLEVHDGEVLVTSSALVYIATPENPDWLGPATAQAIARQVHDSVGPSGPNLLYFRELISSIRGLGVEDPHLEAIGRALEVIELEGKRGG